MKKQYGKYAVILVITGVLGLFFTGISLVNLYKTTSSAKELTVPLIYNFIPFVAFFFIFKKGINELINRKK